VDIAPLKSAANIAATISQRTKITGRKQQKTTSPAAIHLNMIFRTDPNGMSKSTTETRCDDDKTGGGGGGGGGGALGVAVGGGSCVPYFSIGK
jgi:hypothetical protein